MGGRDKERPSDRSRMGVDFNGSTSLPSSLKLFLIILDCSVVDVLVRTRPFGFQATLEHVIDRVVSLIRLVIHTCVCRLLEESIGLIFRRRCALVMHGRSTLRLGSPFHAYGAGAPQRMGAFDCHCSPGRPIDGRTQDKGFLESKKIDRPRLFTDVRGTSRRV